MGNVERVSFVVEGIETTFYCEFTSTRNGFAHKCTWWDPMCDAEPFKLRAYYYNRTWEAWEYQSVCKQVVRQALNECEVKKQYEWMRANEYKRLTEKRRAEWDTFVANLAPNWQERNYYQTLLFRLSDFFAHYHSDAGFRERSILDCVVNVERVQAPDNRTVYRIHGQNGNSCLWDENAKRFVG